MGVLDRLFGHRSESTDAPSTVQEPSEEQGWRPVPAFIPLARDRWTLPAVVATAVAAADRPESSFSVRNVEIANPEALRVGSIAAAIAAADRPESSFSVKRVFCKTSA